jgi:ABC-type molybdate transport system substrate-binding protein
LGELRILEQEMSSKGLERDFIDFILSEKGQRIIEEEGFVSI